MKKILSPLLLLISAACSPSTSNQSSSPDLPAVTSADTVLEQPQQAQEPEVAAVLPLDSSAFAWQDGYRVVPWPILDEMELEWVYEEDLEQEIPYPIFNPQVLALNGQPIQVSGYAIPLEETGTETIVILSAYPYSQCFFCGGAGPGSVLDILPKSPLPKLPFDEKTTFRGKLRLNDDDLQYLNYILDDAELVK
jgi:hypothetical protein